MRFRSVVLFFHDTTRARAWYEAMGFRPLRSHAGMHWFGFGDGERDGEVMLHPAEVSSGGSGLSIHVGVEDAAAAFRRAVAAGEEPFDHQHPGVRLTGPVTRAWGAVEFEVLDPEGHRWAFTQDG